jgi:hypothetical protein
MTQDFAGSCLCGAIAFELTGDIAAFFLCYCSRCRKGTGSAHAANLFAPDALIYWTRGAEHLRQYQHNNSRHCRSFCPTCASPMPQVQPDCIVIPAGCLDQVPEVPISAGICWSDRAKWVDGIAAADKTDGLPQNHSRR